MSCHDTANPHPTQDASHTATPRRRRSRSRAETFGPVACADCHALPLLTTLHTGTCKTCHPTPKNTLTPAWDKSCTQGGCHTATSSAPMHASIDASHAPVAGQTCYAAGCHPATATDSLAQTHRNACATLGGQVRTSCQVCHWNGTPASRACASCHADVHGDLDEAHRSAPAAETITILGTSFGQHACSECHASTDLRTLHGGGDASCATCHPTAYATVAPDWDRSCAQGGCHTIGSTKPKHAEIDPAHALSGSKCWDGACHDWSERSGRAPQCRIHHYCRNNADVM